MAPAGTVLAYVGGIYTQDALLMARAFERVRQVKPDTQLLLIGYFNRSLEAWLQDPAPIIRTGPVSGERLQEYLAACDVCWLPLKDSGANRGRWPFKLSDYMAAGRPVVATNVGDIAEVVRQHRLGVIADDNPADFAAATLDLLADSPLRLELGQFARQAAQGAFSWDRLTDDLERHYWRTLNGGFN
jgi:glycosyltransferase involved in cell wall biosynthesis